MKVKEETEKVGLKLNIQKSKIMAGESQGRGSLVSCRLWGHTELDTTEVT